jgi:DNA-binding protein H-NS
MTGLTRKELERLSIDELWTLRNKIVEILSANLAQERRLLEDRLRRLDSTWPRGKPPRRPYPKVLPQFRNPDLPSQTWSGRGKKPRWFSAQLRSGKRINDLRITHVAQR